MPEKQYKTEWSFSFDKVGQKFSDMVGSINNDEEIKHAHFEEPVNGTSTANIALNLSVGRTTVSMLENPNLLFEADVAYVGEMEFAVSGDDEKTIKLGQKKMTDSVMGAFKRTLRSVSNRGDIHWDVRLNPSVPLKLSIDGGVGTSEIDLSSLNLTRLTMDGGVGSNIIKLPATGKGYHVTIDGGVGGTMIEIPENAAVDVDIDGGVGGVKVNLPHTAAVRVTVDGNLGGVHIPKQFKRVKENDDFIGRSGVWETPGYAVAGQQVAINFKGGVGSLSVRMIGEPEAEEKTE